MPSPELAFGSAPRVTGPNDILPAMKDRIFAAADPIQIASVAATSVNLECGAPLSCHPRDVHLGCPLSLATTIDQVNAF